MMDPIDAITIIRSNNNRLWMALLRLALKAEPIRAKEIIAKINKNDKEVSEWLGKI